ncbi:dmt superfamily [Leptolyngbya sp. Heron Island J]|uniref:DMT family transporter n=1 Tax=Leptolyngbya sp. Heron Island J TaxID=1385935 RepID=UPI0003B9A572|nr:DMT family transporter [Leptolyngbya sp. Heron Island J]ESA33347.1 dmt superfamily [Leptolyngbya sp. Heron Island J]
MNSTLLAIGYAFCWGMGVTLTKVALSAITPTTLLIIQLFSSVLFLITVCWLTAQKLPFSWQHLKQGVAGIFEPALAYMFGIVGIQMTTASNATLIGSTEVILTILLAAIFLNERLTRLKLLLASISFVGVSLLMLKDVQNTDQSSLMGDVLVLVGTLFAVFYALLSKRQIATAHPLQLTTSQQTIGLITTVLCFGGLSLLNPVYAVSAANISLPFWLLAIGSGIMQYALAFLLYLIALQTVPASHAAFYLTLIPVFGVTSAVLIIGEQPSFAQAIGGCLVVASSYCANRLTTL